MEEHEHRWVRCRGCTESSDKEYCGGVRCANRYCKFSKHAKYVSSGDRKFPGYGRESSIYEKFHPDERRI